MTTGEFHRLVHALLASSGIPAWLEGHVPDGQACPYMVYGAVRGGFGIPGMIGATAWFDGPDAAVQRSAWMDAMETLLPRSGVKLVSDGGMVVIRRDDKAFMETAADDHDPHLAGARMQALVYVYG